jgi:A/G-specific adenine glycosylase
MNKKLFTRQLMQWHSTANNRSLPWKEEKDPYKIWLSEIILQQTRAQQGVPYYLKFTEAYPTVKHLAKTEDEKAFRLWQGLGYYNRCKNMLATARLVVSDWGGKFPTSYDDLLSLKGIGPYTASAIASFAYNLPTAVVDGNVYRVLSRYFGISEPIDSTEGKKIFKKLADELLDTENSAAYNQAIMDLGATVCTPQKPACDSCPLQKNCIAYRQGLTDALPVKSKKLRVRKRYFHYIFLHADDKVWIRKRPSGDIWENLHEPLLVEHEQPLDIDALKKHSLIKSLNINKVKLTAEGESKQKLTHQTIETLFFSMQLNAPIQMPDNEGKWVKIKELKKYAFPKTVLSFLEKKVYF